MSAFRVDPNNILGREAKAQRQKLLAVALAKPENYYAFKEDVESKITSNMVKGFYNTFYALLTEGGIAKLDKDGNVTGIDQFQYKDANDSNVNWKPKLPESVVAKFSMKVAQMIEEICEEALEEALPASITDLAVNKQKKILDTKVSTS